MKSKIFIFTTLILVVFLFVITSCNNFLNGKNNTTININLDLSKILKTSRNETTSNSTEYILKVFAYNAASYKPKDEIENLPLLTQTENKVDVNGNVKARLDVTIGLNVIFVAKLYQGEAEEPIYAGKSEVIKIKITNNKVHLVLSKENADLDTDILIHDHTFAPEWTKNETHHWHAATCEHTTEVSGKEEHSFGDWNVTQEPTEEAEGSRKRSCTVCGYTATEVIEKLAHTHTFSTDWTKDETYHWHAATCGHTTEVSEKEEHSFGDWNVTQEPTEKAEGSRKRSCTVCGYTATEVIEKLAHTHTFSTDWTSDATHHWYAATCEHTDETRGFAEHTFGEYVSNNDATTEADGTKTRECSVCGYKDTVTDEGSKIKIPEGFVLVEGTTITGKENWKPTSSVFVSGRELKIPNLLVSDHEVTRGEYLEVIKSDPSIASAYDKDGNILTGDAVLNNPVNGVSWYDALVYCNKLSIQENLTPCYTINSSKNPEDWGPVPTSSDSTWNAATCDFEANGYRLPTEAEWEWLARGGEKYTYAGSDTIDDVAWYDATDKGTREVKTKAPNGYGLYDMSGNVWEWCWDSDGTTSGSNRVMRGGCWDSNLPNFCAVSNRTSDPPTSCRSVLGFRVVRNAPTE